MEAIISVATLLISLGAFGVSLYNAVFNYRKYKYDSYLPVAIKRLYELEENVIALSVLAKNYNHVRFTLWELDGEDTLKYSVADLNKISDDISIVESKIKFIVSIYPENKIVACLEEIKNKRYDLPNQLWVGNEEKAHEYLYKDIDKLLTESRFFIARKMKSLQKFNIKHL